MRFDEYDIICGQINRLYNSFGSKDKKYWHYTSLSAILSMFQNYINTVDITNQNVKDCTIYASNARYMNDPEEFLEGKNLYAKFSRPKNPITFNYSLISFSNKGDNLDHWKYYGKDSGVSLCFDIDKVETCVFKDKSTDKDKYDSNNRPLKVHYEDDDKENYYKILKKRIKEGYLKAEYLNALFVPFCKDEAFKDEAEYRMVFFDTINSDFKYNTADTHRIKPATNVKFRLKEPSTIDPLFNGLNIDLPSKSDNIISRIVVGPGNNQELVFNNLLHVFDRCNYDYVEVPLKTNKIKPIPEASLSVGASNWIECEDDNKIRFAHRCHNGVLILISAISFRA